MNERAFVIPVPLVQAAERSLPAPLAVAAFVAGAAMEWPSSCPFVETRARKIALIALRCLARLVRLDLGQLRRDATLGFQSVIGILQPQEIAFRQAEELAETQIGITGDGAGPIDDGVDAIARNANRMRELVLAHADWV